MDIEKVREYCLSLPATSEDMPFGEDYLILRVCGKIFACIGLVRKDYFVLKCNADYAVELRERYSYIEPAWHWNKRYWNQIRLSDGPADEFMKHMIRHSYCEVVRKLPRKVAEDMPEVKEVSDTDRVWL